MGVYIKLSVLSDQILEKEWKEFYEDSLKLLKGYSGEIMGIQKEKKGSLTRHYYSREIEHGKNDSGKRHWSVVGDFASRETGESFSLYQDINHYCRKTFTSGVYDDILLHIIDDYKDSDKQRKGNFCSVFHSKTQGHSYHIPVLAVAMLAEDRFSGRAAASGNIDVYQARKAKEFIREILNNEVHLPICTDTVRLYNRIKRYYDDDRGIEYFEIIYRGSQSDLYKELRDVYDSDIIQQWFMTKLSDYDSPSQFGCLDMFIAWLNSTHDPEPLCHMACIDKKGPGFAPADFADALASTWISIDKDRQGIMDIFLKPEGDTDTVFSQFGMIFMDMGGFKGRDMKFHMKEEHVLSILEKKFPLDFSDTKQAFVKRNNEEKEKLDLLTEPVRSLTKRVYEDRSDPLGDTFPILETMADATEDQIFMLRGAAAGLRRLEKNLTEEEKERFDKSNQELIEIIIFLTEKMGPKLSEDAWEWIDKEEDTQFLRFLALLLMIDNHEQKFWNMRKGILENRNLARDVFEMFNDPEIESFLEEPESEPEEG